MARTAHIVQILVEQNPVGLAFHILELATAGGPEEDPHRHQAEQDHARQQPVNHIHCCNLDRDARGQSSAAVPWLSRAQRTPRNRVRIRAALPMTASELTGMETAASSGVMNAMTASGTMMML